MVQKSRIYTKRNTQLVSCSYNSYWNASEASSAYRKGVLIFQPLQKVEQIASPFSDHEYQKYSRQLLLPEMGIEGQTKLKNARVLVVGLGGLGSPVALYLAAAGVGTLGVIDDDVVQLSNLHRQVLFGSDDIGRSKVHQGAEHLRKMHPNIDIIEHEVRLQNSNARDIVAQYNIIVDATDNFAARYLINETCIQQGIPYIYGSVHKFEGQASIFAAKSGPCYACIYPNPPEPSAIPNCDEIGVLGVVPGMIGMTQATETLKLLLGVGNPLVGRLLVFDALAMKFSEFNIAKNPSCSVCGDHPKHANATVMHNTAVTVEELALMRSTGIDHLLLDIREPFEYEIANIGGTLIPMNEIQEQEHELPRGKDMIVMCHVGQRSAAIVRYLRSKGFANVRNLIGGIEAWSSRIDPSVRRY
jgi:adenylyltransferase/sulfurtransferase